MNLQDLGTNVLYEIIATVIIGLSTYSKDKFFLLLNRQNPINSPRLVFINYVVWGVFNIINFILFMQGKISILLLIIPLYLTTIFIFLFTYKELNQYWRIGFRGTDSKILDGIDYSRSLGLVNNSFEFLGIGAAKLTRETGFSNALHRCLPEKPIRFLLSKPSDQNLLNAAKRANKPKEQYKNIVLNSLKIISELRRDRNFNIQVRFYPEQPQYFPIFRLVFIDEVICLLSYNVFGEGDGSQLPQLHLVKSNDREVNSLYYAFENFYNKLWDISEPWDFVQYLGS